MPEGESPSVEINDLKWKEREGRDAQTTCVSREKEEEQEEEEEEEEEQEQEEEEENFTRKAF